MTKLTIIGAGSAVFTKNIFTDLMFIDDFKKMDLKTLHSLGKENHVLYDIKNLFSAKDSDLRL